MSRHYWNRTGLPNFRAWLRAQTRRHDPVGDIAREVFADADLRGRRLSPGLLIAYLEGLPTCCPEALEAGHRTVTEYLGV